MAVASVTPEIKEGQDWAFSICFTHYASHTVLFFTCRAVGLKKYLMQYRKLKYMTYFQWLKEEKAIIAIFL